MLVAWALGGCVAPRSGPPTEPVYASVEARAAAQVAILEQAWSMVNRRFYDPGFNGADWATAVDRYRDAAAQASDTEALYDVINDMLGELDDAHTGALSPRAAWEDYVAERAFVGINLERVDRMIAAARRNGRILAAVFPSRLGIGARTVKSAMEAGRFGRLTLCSAYIKWWRSQAYYDEGGWHGTWALDGGGAMMNQAIHYVDLLQWLVGMPVRVHAFAGSLAHERIEVEDTLVASVQYANGALGVIECATSCSPGYARRIEICGDRGSIILEDDTITRWEFAGEQPGDDEIRKGRVSSGLKGGTADPRAVSCEGHRLQIEDLVHALREGRPPAIPGEDGRHAVAIVRAAYESAQTGQVVELAD